jgi:hypothetical protein
LELEVGGRYVAAGLFVATTPDVLISPFFCKIYQYLCAVEALYCLPKQKQDRGSNKRHKTIIKEKQHVRIAEDDNEYHPSHNCLDELKEMKSVLWWTKSERLRATQEGLKIVRTFRKEHGKKHVSITR